MQKRRFDAIAFDWDGTLFDSTAIIVRCIQLAVRDVGGQPPSQNTAAYVIGMGLMQALAYAAPDVPKEKHQELENRYRFHYWKHQNDLSLFEGVLPMLTELRARGYMLAIATGKSRRGLDEVMQVEDLCDFFAATRTADETAGKPNPLMLQELMVELGVKASRLLMIGDTTHDLELASNAGCACVAVSYGAHAPSFFDKYQPLFTAKSTVDLHHWLIQNG